MSAEGWDLQFSTGKWDYLKTSPIERLRLSTMGTMIIPSYFQYHHKKYPITILDMGCGEGLLVDYLLVIPEEPPDEIGNKTASSSSSAGDSVYEYVGVDISKVAIQRALQLHNSISNDKKKNHPFVKSHWISTTAHQFSEILQPSAPLPPSSSTSSSSSSSTPSFSSSLPVHYDFIVFSEMLYYVEYRLILQEYEKFLRPPSPEEKGGGGGDGGGGKFIISLYFPENNRKLYEEMLSWMRDRYELVDNYEVSGWANAHSLGQKSWVTNRIDVLQVKKPAS